MTRFWREGFYRTNAYGTESWVTGHWVERDNWDRGGLGGNTANARWYLNIYWADRSRLARYINPNAECPVCQAPVFFYQNEYGSRVYFDELGPPWPKHPCTDNAKYSITRKKAPEYIEPQARADSQIESIEFWASYLPNHEQENASSWKPVKVLKRFKGYAKVFLILQELENPLRKKVYINRKSLPKCLHEGAVLLLRRSVISFFNSATMLPMEIDVSRIRSASAFIDELTYKPEDISE